MESRTAELRVHLLRGKEQLKRLARGSYTSSQCPEGHTSFRAEPLRRNRVVEPHATAGRQLPYCAQGRAKGFPREIRDDAQPSKESRLVGIEARVAKPFTQGM